MLRSQLQSLFRPQCSRRLARLNYTKAFYTTATESHQDPDLTYLNSFSTQLDSLPVPLPHDLEEADRASLSGSLPVEDESMISVMQRNRAARQLLIKQMSEYGSTQTRDNTFQPHHSLHKPLSPSQSTLSSLLAAGAHLGHSKSLLNPNFMPYVYGNRAGISIIDLDQTLPLLRRAANVTRAITYRGGSVLFIGTRPDLRLVVQKSAERLGETQGFYVGERWLPGTLTNKMQSFGPDVVRSLNIVPDLVVLLNPLANMNAIRECALSHVPTIGIIDSNADPRIVMYPIPANDESTRTAELIAGMLSMAGKEGNARRAREEEAAAQEKLLREEKRKRYGSSDGRSRKPNNYYAYE
jgi:small subunit ribosomal protein S2